jgi:hypothetical protein
MNPAQGGPVDYQAKCTQLEFELFQATREIERLRLENATLRGGPPPTSMDALLRFFIPQGVLFVRLFPFFFSLMKRQEEVRR